MAGRGTHDHDGYPMNFLNSLPFSTDDAGMACAAGALLLAVKVSLELAATWPSRRRRRQLG